MGNTVHILVRMMMSFTYLQIVRTASVTLIGLDTKMCSRSSSADPQFLNEYEFYEIHWNGTVLPSVCSLVFQANGHHIGDPDRTNYRTCVKANSFNVTDCRFSMTVEKNGSGLKSVKTCGDTKLPETCTEPGEALYIVFHTSAVTQGYISLTVSAKRVDNDVTESINMVLLVASVIGAILLVILAVLVSMYIFIWNKDRKKAVTEDPEPGPYHRTMPKSYYMYNHRFDLNKTGSQAGWVNSISLPETTHAYQISSSGVVNQGFDRTGDDNSREHTSKPDVRNTFDSTACTHDTAHTSIETV